MKKIIRLDWLGEHGKSVVKLGMRCSVCKSEDVRRDADAAWNKMFQEWELAGVYDNAICERCGGETSIEEFEIDAQSR